MRNKIDFKRNLINVFEFEKNIEIITKEIKDLFTKEPNIMNSIINNLAVYELCTKRSKSSNVAFQYKSISFVYMKKPVERDKRENQFSIILPENLRELKKGHHNRKKKLS